MTKLFAALAFVCCYDFAIKRRKRILYESIKMFNELPNDIKEAKNIHSFKKLCKDFVKNRGDPFNSEIYK